VTDPTAIDPRAPSRSAPAFVPPAPPRTPKSSETRRRLLQAAAELFVARGYDAVSMRDLAAAAGLTKGAVYGHFRSKGQLLVETIRWKLAVREHAPGFAEQAAARERGVSLMYDEEARQILLLEVDAAAAARHDRDVEAGLAELYLDRQERMREAMLNAPDPAAAAWLVSAITAGIAMKQAARVPLPDPERLRTIILAALRSDPDDVPAAGDGP
jgi:AcrR family transcriptional regulator